MPRTDSEKYCPRCKVVKPLHDFAVVKTGRQAGKVSGYCRVCAAEYQREICTEPPEVKLARQRDWEEKRKVAAEKKAKFHQEREALRIAREAKAARVAEEKRLRALRPILGCNCSKCGTHIPPEELFSRPICRECRRLAKERRRRAAGVPTRAEQIAKLAEINAKRARERKPPQLHASHVSAYRQAKTLHDSHVRLFKKTARWDKYRYQNDPQYYLMRRVRRWMHKHLRDQLPSYKWSKVLHYTPAQLRAHLELRFKPGMTWENKGEWHIDHIRPVSSFKINSVHSEAFRECFGLANLQPLWWWENVSKGAKLDWVDPSGWQPSLYNLIQLFAEPAECT